MQSQTKTSLPVNIGIDEANRVKRVEGKALLPLTFPYSP
jgi:hypothetical protein